MAQEHQEGNSVDPANQSMRRKRGRPRKDDVSGSEPYRSRRRKGDAETHVTDPFVGQVISGVLDGKFDAGYMLTVRIGERGSVLRGVVFEPGLSVPISPENDIAPNVKMFKRDEVSLPPAQQVPYFTPIRSRKDGALRYRQRNDSSKEIYADTVAEDLNVKVPMDSSVNTQKLPENNSNHVSGNLNHDLKPTTDDHASKDGTWDVQTTNVGAECSGDIHAPEIGNTSGIASDRTKVIHMQEEVCQDKSITEQPETASEFKKAATPDGKVDSISDNLTGNLQEVVGDVKLDTQISELSCEAKQTVESSDAALVSISEIKIASLHEVNDDGESQTKTFVPKEAAETSDTAPVIKGGASDECGVVLPPVTIPASEQNIGVNETRPFTNVSETKTSETNQPSEESDSGPILTNGASDDHVKVPLPEHTTDTADHSRVVPPPGTQLSVNESAPQHSVKLDLGDETAKVAEMNSSVGRGPIAQ